MWKPPERIKHAPPPLATPTVAEAEGSRLFSPLSLASGLTLQERTWVPAMVPWRATADGFVTDAVLGWYERFARGQPGAIVVEATGIRDIPSGPLLRIGHVRFLPGLHELTETVHNASAGRTRLFIQIIDFLRIRRRPLRDRYLGEFLAITAEHRQRLEALAPGVELDSDAAVRAQLTALDNSVLATVLDEREYEALTMGWRERVTDVEDRDIAELPRAIPELFAAAAVRARDAGFDGVELHYAHAYTMASFLSARNTRTDGYGGSREGRVRLPVEVLRAVRSRVGSDFTVGCRILCDDAIPGGSDAADASYFGATLAQAGVDFVSLSTGGKFEDAKQPKVGEAAYPYTGPSGYECMPTWISDARGPFARNIGKQALVRAAIRAAGLTTPTVAVGGICDFAQAEALLASGQADIIGAARQSLADPDWFRKIRLGRAAEIRRCSFSNYCEALDERHKTVTCQLWDRVGVDEPGVATTDEGKRRLVAPEWTP